MVKILIVVVATLGLIFGTGASDAGCEPEAKKSNGSKIKVEEQSKQPQMRAGRTYKVTPARYGVWSSSSFKNKCNWTITHTGKVRGKHLKTRGGMGRGKTNSFVLNKKSMTFASDGNCGTFYKKGK